MTTYTLEDCVLRHIEDPGFRIPPKREREDILPGWAAKLVFLDAEGRGERMWVRVKSRIVSPEGVSYVGLLDNDPVVIPLKCGDTVGFRPEHVCAIENFDPRN